MSIPIYIHGDSTDIKQKHVFKDKLNVLVTV